MPLRAAFHLTSLLSIAPFMTFAPHVWATRGVFASDDDGVEYAFAASYAAPPAPSGLPFMEQVFGTRDGAPFLRTGLLVCFLPGFLPCLRMPPFHAAAFFLRLISPYAKSDAQMFHKDVLRLSGRYSDGGGCLKNALESALPPCSSSCLRRVSHRENTAAATTGDGFPDSRF